MGLKEIDKKSKYQRGCVYVMGGRGKRKEEDWQGRGEKEVRG